MPNLNFAEAFKNYMNCAHWMLSNPKMPNCADTSSTQPPRQRPGLLFSFIPNQPLSRQGKSLQLCICIMVTGSKGLYPSSPIKSTPQIQTMMTYQNLGWSAAFLSAVFFADAFFVSTISIADFGHAAFGHSPVQQ